MIRFDGPTFNDFQDVFEKDLVVMQALAGETFIDRVVSFRHPYKTGRMRASWRVNKTGAFFDIAPQGAVPNQFNIYPSGKVKAPPYTITYVTNGVPYSGLVDQGIGMSYPRNVVRPALKYTARQFR